MNQINYRIYVFSLSSLVLLTNLTRVGKSEQCLLAEVGLRQSKVRVTTLMLLDEHLCVSI